MNNDDTVMHAPFEPPLQGFCTTRAGGASLPPFDSFNLAATGGDDPDRVEENRCLLRSRLPSSPAWLRQVHGDRVIHLDDWHEGIEADAAWTDRPGQVAAVLTADCLPLLVGDRSGGCVSAIHAGWRGLAAGVIPRCIAELPVDPARLVAWVGPRICRKHYEVGEEVHSALAASGDAFEATRPGHWLANLAAIAEAQLRAAGVGEVIDCNACTAEGSRFFSYRREQRTGRMASVIWIAEKN